MKIKQLTKEQQRQLRNLHLDIKQTRDLLDKQEKKLELVEKVIFGVLFEISQVDNKYRYDFDDDIMFVIFYDQNLRTK
jgi:hypothetical protein